MRAYLQSVLDKKALDGLGLIYGMGHAVYSLSDPPCRGPAGLCAGHFQGKGPHRGDGYVPHRGKGGPGLLTAHRQARCGECGLYSGFLYDMLGLPKEAIYPSVRYRPHGRLGAHPMEELGENSKIIRPACKCIEKRRAIYP